MIKVGTRGQKSLLSLALVLFLSDYIYSGTQVFAHSLFTDGIKGKDKGSHRINISYAKIEDCRFIVKRYNFLGSSFFYIPQFATTKPLPSQRVFDNNTKVNAMKDGKKIQIIEWHDMDKRRFYAYSLMLGTTIRFSVYPLNLIKTRLQVRTLILFQQSYIFDASY